MVFIIRVGHVYVYMVLTEIAMAGQLLARFRNIRFHENPFNDSLKAISVRTGRQNDFNGRCFGM